MRNSIIAAVILLTVPLAGCAAPDDGGGGEAPEPVEVAWTQQPQDMDAGQAVDVGWELTGPERHVQHTGLHWAEDSVSNPSTPADYGNTSGAVEPADVPGEYDTTVTIDETGTYYFRAHAIVDGNHTWTSEVEIQVESSQPGEAPVIVTVDDHTAQGGVGENLTVNWSLTGTPDEVRHTGFHWATYSVEDPASPADYGNSTGVVEPAAVPGSYNGTFTEEEPGTYHGRAHAIYNGQHYWSDEITFEVQAGGDGGGGGSVTHHTVEMSGVSFDPAELEVEPGDTINWTNLDQYGHTVTFQNETLEIDEDVAAGEYFNWTVPEDLAPGTYEYRCENHSAEYGGPGMTGTIVVE